VRHSFPVPFLADIAAYVLLVVVAIARTSAAATASAATASIDAACGAAAKLAESTTKPSDNVVFLERRSLDPNGTDGHDSYGPWVKVAAPTPHPGESVGTEGVTAVTGAGGALTYAVESMVGNSAVYDACYRAGVLVRARLIRHDPSGSARDLRVVYYEHGRPVSDSAPNDATMWDPTWFTIIDAGRRSFFPAIAIPLGRL